ncbi:hypothetical protein M9Y10_041623 [Tritrichomonas musculus]|uniref:F-box domain-containing protein n=1 Tax=Tritrichomonas musculus TaxID=1915356 RepID=A0ABR2K4V9_9EUKA
MESTSFGFSGLAHGSSYVDSLALNPKFHSLSSYLKKMKASDPQLRITEQQATKLESLLKSVNESLSSLNDSNFSVSYDAFIKFYKSINLSHNLLHRYYKGATTEAENELQKMNDELEPLKEKSKETDDLKNQVNELKSKLAMLPQQMVQDISKQLKLPSKPTDSRSLVRVIRQALQKSQTHFKQLVTEFNLPKSTTNNTLLRDLKKVINDQIQQKQDEIDALNDQVEDLKGKVLTENDFSKDQDKKTLQKTIIKQKKQIQQLEKELQDPNRCKDEIESILKLYDDLSKQYRKQSDEILDAINSRATLITAVEKQNQIIIALENQFEKLSESKEKEIQLKTKNNRKENRKGNKSPRNSPKNSPKNSPSKESTKANIDNEIIAILSKIPICHDEIQAICDSQIAIPEKVCKSIDLITDYSYNNQSLQSTNQKLFSVILGQFKFIYNLTNSKKTFEALNPEASYEEYRSILISQSGRIQNFINTYAKGLSEDSCLFEDLLNTQNSQDLLNNIKQYLDEYSKPQTLESEELFILLLQAVSCNDILRKYGDEARKHNTILSQRYKSMKDSSDRAKKALEAQSTSMIQDSKLQDTISAAKSIIRKSIILDQNQSSDLINCLDDLDNVAPVKDSQYIKTLQKQNGDFRKEITELRREKANLINQTKSDLELAQTKIQNVKSDFTKKLTKKADENKTLVSNLRKTINAYQNLRKENQRLSSETQRSQKQLEDSKILVSEIQDQLNSTKADFDNIVKETKEKSSEVHEAMKHEISQIKQEMQKSQDILSSENDKLKKALLNEKKSNEKLNADHSEAIKELKQNEMDALTAAEQLGKKYSELHSDYQNLEIEFRALKSRFDSKNETVKRDKAILESQMKAQIMSIQHDARASVEAEKIAQCAKLQLFMNEVCKFFPEYVNLESPISEDTVFKMLKKMKEKIKKNEVDKENIQILKDISKIINVAEYSSIPLAIESLCQELQEQKQAIDEAEVAKSTILHCNEWLKRIYSILTDGMMDNANCAMMEKTIEDAVLASLGKNTVLQRLETLKVEKILLLRKVQDAKSKKGDKISLRHLMIMMMYIMRLKKISGHMDNNQYSFAVQFNKATDSESDNLAPESPFLNLTYQE